MKMRLQKPFREYVDNSIRVIKPVIGPTFLFLPHLAN